MSSGMVVLAHAAFHCPVTIFLAPQNGTHLVWG